MFVQTSLLNMLAFANAKFNVGLNIIEKRPDGYHNLETVFVPLKLYDVVEIVDAPATDIHIHGMDIPGSEKDNLCLRAFDLLAADYHLAPQQIHLLKQIPIGAGLGGGSADAAFVLKLLNDKFTLGLTVSQLESYASRLGADCAFFIQNTPAFASGIGELLEPVPLDLSHYFTVLVKPAIHVSTATAYSKVVPKRPAASLKDLIQLPVEQWRAHIKNDFEESVFAVYPKIEKIKLDLYGAGALFALMSGSGSSVVGVFEAAVDLKDLEANHQVFYNV